MGRVDFNCGQLYVIDLMDFCVYFLLFCFVEITFVFGLVLLHRVPRYTSLPGKASLAVCTRLKTLNGVTQTHRYREAQQEMI